jgi:MFS family permease
MSAQGFVNQFGTYSSKTGRYAIDSLHTSLLTSLAFIGKFAGCLLAGPAIEKYGHRTVFFGLSIISVIGIISEFAFDQPRFRQYLLLSLVEITSAGTGVGTGRLAQFVVGRIVVYISVGLVEVNVTCAFQFSEIWGHR